MPRLVGSSFQRDWVISSENDGGAIASVFRGSDRFTSVVLEGLDHFLLRLDSKRASVEKFSGGMKGELSIHPDFIPAVSKLLQAYDRCLESDAAIKKAFNTSLDQIQTGFDAKLERP